MASRGALNVWKKQAVDVAGSWQRKLSHFAKSDFFRGLPYWLIPFFIMGMGVYLGIGYNTLISLTDYSDFARPDYGQLDLEMYQRALTDPTVHNAAKNNLALLLGFTVASVSLGLFLAVLLDRDLRHKGKFQTIYLLPMALSNVVTALVWLWMFNFNNGLLNTVIGVVGLGPFKWIGNSQLVLSSIIFALVWQFSGYCMIVFLAGLQSIPDEQYEAAIMDGASSWRAYIRVLIPQLKSVSVGAVVVLMLFALRTFTFLFSMFGSYRVPKGTDILSIAMVRQAFKFQNWSYSAAIGTIQLVMALAVISPYLYYQYKTGSL